MLLLVMFLFMGRLAKVQRGSYAMYKLVFFSLLGSLCLGLGILLIYVMLGTTNLVFVSEAHWCSQEYANTITGLLLFGLWCKLPA